MKIKLLDQLKSLLGLTSAVTRDRLKSLPERIKSGMGYFKRRKAPVAARPEGEDEVALRPTLEEQGTSTRLLMVGKSFWQLLRETSPREAWTTLKLNWARLKEESVLYSESRWGQTLYVVQKIFSKIPVDRLKERVSAQVNAKLNRHAGDEINYFAYLDEKYRAIIHQVFILSLFCVSAYSIGKIAGTFLNDPASLPDVRPVSITPASLDEIDKGLMLIASNNLFGPLDDGLSDAQKKKALSPVKCSEAQTPSSLPVKLVNTSVMHDSMKSVASFQAGGGDLIDLREGEKLKGMASIDKIDRLMVIVKNLESGECEYIVNREFEQELNANYSILSPQDGRKLMRGQRMSGINNDGNKFMISRKLFLQKMGEIDQILTQAKAIPIPNPDGTFSFKITQIVPDSIYANLGIQENDKITQINGKKIMGINEVMNMFASIQTIDKLQMTVVREDGNEEVLDYSFDKKN